VGRNWRGGVCNFLIEAALRLCFLHPRLDYSVHCKLPDGCSVADRRKFIAGGKLDLWLLFAAFSSFDANCDLFACGRVGPEQNRQVADIPVWVHSFSIRSRGGFL